MYWILCMKIKFLSVVNAGFCKQQSWYTQLSTLWRCLVHAVLKVGRYGMPELSQLPREHTGLPFNKILNTGREEKGGGTPSWRMLLNEFSSKSRCVLLHKILSKLDYFWLKCGDINIYFLFTSLLCWLDFASLYEIICPLYSTTVSVLYELV